MNTNLPIRTNLAPFLSREKQELTIGGAPEASTNLFSEVSSIYMYKFIWIAGSDYHLSFVIYS